MANRHPNKKLKMSAVYLADAKHTRTEDTDIYEAYYVIALKVRIEVSILN
jgi:hypothetical protein